MKINMDALKALELKLAEYAEANGTIAEHESANKNGCSGGCTGMCGGGCTGTMTGGCGTCTNRCNGRCSGSCKSGCSGTGAKTAM